MILNIICVIQKLFPGFILGILASIIAAILLNFLHSNFYTRIKYRHFLGTYNHPRGSVKISHLKGEHFLTTGTENNGVIWKGNLRYLNNSVFIGVYDWNPGDGLNDWGEHNLHVLPNGDISVIWTNKSENKETRGWLIWEKEK